MHKFIVLLMTFIVIACSDHSEKWGLPAEYGVIKQLIDKGNLLKETIKQDDIYIFQFETDTVSLPVSAIAAVETDPEEWNTLVTFADETVLSIPTIGNSLDNFVTNYKLNPSGYCPLAAKYYFYLPVPGCIKVVVHSKPGSRTPDVTHTYSSLNRSLDALILGLYPNYENKVDLIYTDSFGNERATMKLTIKTGPIEVVAFSDLRIIKASIEKMEPGMNLISSPGRSEMDTSIPYIVDADGELRWILDWKNSPDLLHIGAQCGLQRMKNGNYIVGDFNHSKLFEINLLGEIVHTWDLGAMGYTFHHEVREEDNGLLLVAVTKKNAMQPDGKNVRILDHVIEINPDKQEMVNEWDFITMMDYKRQYPVGGDLNSMEAVLQPNQSNWLHNNGVTTWGENDILATARWQGVFKYTRKGTLKWVISPHAYWSGAFNSYLLQPLDKSGQPINDIDVIEGRKDHSDFGWPWGPHCPVVTPEGHVLVFDNGYCRNFKARGYDDPTAYSRIVEYEVDEVKRTVREVWSYGQERGRSCYAMAISSVQALKQTGNRLFCPGVGNKFNDGKTGGRIVEVDPLTNEVVFEMEVACPNEHTFHRANRISLYPENQ